MKLLIGHARFIVGTVGLILNFAGCASSVEKGEPGAAVALSTPMSGSQNIDARYTPGGVRLGFAALCKSLGYRARRVEVDQSEFPFLVYGVLEGRCDYRDIRDTLNSMRGYAYTGCVTSVRSDGSITTFALNMTPSSEYALAGNRLMERLKTLANSQR